MELALIIYLVETLIGAVCGIAVAAAVLLVVIAIVVTAIHFEQHESYNRDKPKTWDKYPVHIISRLCVSSFLCVCVAVLIPNEKTAYAMLAAYGVTEIAKNERVQELGSKSLEVLERAMDKYIQDTEPETQE